MSQVNEYEMNIYVMYDKFDSIIEDINATFKFNNDKNDKGLEKNIASFWKWTPLPSLESILNTLKTKIKICSDKNNNHKFKEVIIIQNANISFDEFFDSLTEIIDENGDYYHPFIIFLSKEKFEIDFNDYYSLDKKKFFFCLFQKMNLY